MTGGFTGLQNTKSTEILTTGATAWMTVGPLPKARNGLRATSVDNIIYVLGMNIMSRLGSSISNVLQVEIQRY